MAELFLLFSDFGIKKATCRGDGSPWVLGRRQKIIPPPGLSLRPSAALHPPAHILICTGGCALQTNTNPAQSGGIISCLRPKREKTILIDTVKDSKNQIYAKIVSLPLKVEEGKLIYSILNREQEQFIDELWVDCK
jgi:hypothetical protein